MKNLLTHISPSKEFCNDEHKMAVKIQIDNSLELGWKKEDISLITNFDYEYNGVKSSVIGGENYCSITKNRLWTATKIYVIDYLFKNNLIENDLYWYHDFDCWQLNPLTDIETDMVGVDMGLTNYGRMPRLCSASMFFRNTAGDIFSKIKEEVNRVQRDEETVIASLINSDVDLKKRVKLLNTTYAFQKWNMHHSYHRSDKPIKAVHFHLTPDKYDFFVNGNNRTNLKIIPGRLIDIFNYNGFYGEQSSGNNSNV
jgi:hypothetical protein